MSLQESFNESHYWYNGWDRPYCGVFGHSFIRRLCKRWNRRSLHNDLPFSGEAHGTGGLSVITLQQILEKRKNDLSKFDICFVQIGENDVKTDEDDEVGLNNHELMYALVNVVNEFRRQGVRRVVFGSLFQRHFSGYNKRCKRLNKMLRNIHPDKLWDHGPRLINNEVIDTWDHTHLYRDQEPVFAASIGDAICLTSKDCTKWLQN